MKRNWVFRRTGRVGEQIHPIAKQTPTCCGSVLSSKFSRDDRNRPSLSVSVVNPSLPVGRCFELFLWCEQCSGGD